MRLRKVQISNFRCHKSLELEFDNYIILLGPNGSGKSSVLYALDWFFNKRSLSEEDVHRASACPDRPAQIEVSVEFSHLDDNDKMILGMYGRKDTAWFRRSWSSDGTEKIIGNALQGPGFASVRNASSAREAKTAYSQIRVSVTDLPSWQKREQVNQALHAWEDDPANLTKLEAVNDSDASHLFGFAGPHVLARCFQMILVPAAADLSAEVGTAGKGSILSQVLNTAALDVAKQANREWEEENRDAIRQLEESIRMKLRSATEQDQNRINEHLAEFVPGAQVVLKGVPQPWSMRSDAAIQADVVIDGIQVGLDRQGHGVQRAVLISALQSLVPSRDSDAAPSESDELADNTSGVLSASPAVLLAIEEPEIYQHPVRARHFGKVLQEVASRNHVQVAIATHSPYFVTPDQFPSIYRFVKKSGIVSIFNSNVSDIATRISNTGSDRNTETRLTSFLQRKILGQFSECFFSDGVVLVEGDTDRVILEAAALSQNRPIDRYGLSIIAVGGKQELEIPFRMLEGLGIPIFVLFDGDDNCNETEQARNSRKTQTDGVLRWLPSTDAIIGDAQCSFGSPTTVTSEWAMFNRNLEHELNAWPSFCQRIQELGGSVTGKNVDQFWNAALDCETADMPATISAIVDAIVQFGDRASRRDYLTT